MNTDTIKRACIIGISGSGKTTWSTKLSKQTKLPLFHMDQLFWGKNWEPISEEVWSEQEKEIINNEKWIIEGYINKKDVTMLASMAKLKAGRLGREVTDSCLQYWGGNGYMWENPVSRAFRDVRLVSIGGGADEIMLGIICKLMGTLPKKKK